MCRLFGGLVGCVIRLAGFVVAVRGCRGSGVALFRPDALLALRISRRVET
jgi:hypothetical protein